MNKKNPLVSVIIPTYKRADLIKRAVDSVLEQSYTNIEIIIVDDNGEGSKFREVTKGILQEYIKERKIKYIENTSNKGGALARNIGANAARGEYIAFLDDDDIFLKHKILKQVGVFQNIENKKLALVYCHCNGVDLNGNILWTNKNSYEGEPLYESMIYCIANTSLWLCKKDIFFKIGGFVDMPSKQDLLVFMNFISNGYEVKCVKEVLVEYLDDNHQKISTNEPSKRIVEGYEIFRRKCRNSYKQLSEKEKKDVEFRFSRILCLQYIGLKEKNKAKEEFKNMIKNKKNIGIIGMGVRIIRMDFR